MPMPLADRPSIQGMCKNLSEKGSFTKPLVLYNRTLSRAQELAEKLEAPTLVAQSVTAAVDGASIIFLCLGDDTAVEETFKSILQSTNITGKLFVDCSTVHPDTSRKISEQLESHGASFVACPVFGAPPIADAGKLICVLAGRKEAVQRVKPYCAGVMGRANVDLSEKSEDPGKASELKLMGNSLIFQMVTALSEQMVVAEKSGVGVDKLHDVLELLFPGPIVGYSNRMRSGDYFEREEPLFAVDLARKDIRHSQDVAKGAGAKMKGLDLTDEYLRSVKTHSGQSGDIAAIYGMARRDSGLKFENK